MTRNLLSQIKNDWRENIWLIIELMIVALIIWWLMLTLIRTYKDTHLPLGADINDVYAASITLLDEQGEMKYFDQESTQQEIDGYYSDLQALLDRVRALPMVEAAALGSNALPYNLNFMGTQLSLIEGKDTVAISTNLRQMTPEGARVLKIQSESGLSPEQMQQLLEKGMILISDPFAIELRDRDKTFDVNTVIGKELMANNDPSRVATVGGIIKNIRRNDYEVNYHSATQIFPIMERQPGILNMNTLMVRVKPGKGADFENIMKTDPTLVSPNRIALSKLRSLEQDKRLTTWNSSVKNRAYTAGIIFLLAIIFIGLLGTFWYRVYQRTPEIAVRKTFGATNADIFRRFLSEAMILLLTSIILSTCLCVALMDYLKEGLIIYQAVFASWKWDVTLAWIITAAIMVIMILIGIGIPGMRAMKIEPAIALKEE